MKTKQKLCDGCGELRHIWKNVQEEGVRKRYCKWCWSCHDANQGNKHKPTIRKPLAHRSPKRKKQESAYSLQRKDFLKSKPLCEAAIPALCTQNSTDVHHMAGRVGDLLLDERYWLSVCRACHDWIERHPRESKELGYSKLKTK